MSAAGDQIGDAIASAVSEIVDRFRSGRRLAGDEAVRVGNQAVKIGADAVHRIASEVEHRPLVTLGVAIGVGILIGIMLDAGVGAASRPTGRREKAVHANTRS
jgi:ElaB/YqjD/DUF883 family membrane-anchored ribosome-binding protein